MSMINNLPPELTIPAGGNTGYSSVNKFGSNETIDIGIEDVWEHGGLVNFPASASVMNVASTSAADTSAGTGSRTLTVEGLDSNWDEIAETITLNGQTIVTTTAQFIRVHRAYIITSGSGETNAGDIAIFTGTETAGVPDDNTKVFSTISIGHGQTLQAFYTVPAGKTAYMTAFYGNTDDVSKFIVLKGFFRPAADTADASWRIGMEIKFGGHMQHPYNPYTTFPEKTDLKIQAEAFSNNTYVAGGFDLILVDN